MDVEKPMVSPGTLFTRGPTRPGLPVNRPRTAAPARRPRDGRPWKSQYFPAGKHTKSIEIVELTHKKCWFSILM